MSISDLAAYEVLAKFVENAGGVDFWNNFTDLDLFAQAVASLDGEEYDPVRDAFGQLCAELKSSGLSDATSIYLAVQAVLMPGVPFSPDLSKQFDVVSNSWFPSQRPLRSGDAIFVDGKFSWIASDAAAAAYREHVIQAARHAELALRRQEQLREYEKRAQARQGQSAPRVMDWETSGGPGSRTPANVSDSAKSPKSKRVERPASVPPKPAGVPPKPAGVPPALSQKPSAQSVDPDVRVRSGKYKDSLGSLISAAIKKGARQYNDRMDMHHDKQLGWVKVADLPLDQQEPRLNFDVYWNTSLQLWDFVGEKQLDQFRKQSAPRVVAANKKESVVRRARRSGGK